MNAESTRDDKIRRQAERIAPKAYEYGRKVARKLEGSGYVKKWDEGLVSQKEGWIASIEYALKKCLSPRERKANARKGKRK